MTPQDEILEQIEARVEAERHRREATADLLLDLAGLLTIAAVGAGVLSVLYLLVEGF